MEKRSSFFAFRSRLGTGLFLLFFVFLFEVLDHGSWSAMGEKDGDSFGERFASAGDVNGDGYADLVVSAEGNSDQTGKAYLFLGSRRGLSRFPAWTAKGEAPRVFFGRNLACAGDVNGDGFSDIILGASGHSKPLDGCGKAYLYSGSPQGLSPSPVWTFTGTASMELVGDGVGSAGDVNGDGLSDVLVGAYGADHARGAVQLFLGSKQGLQTGPAWRALGEAAFDWFGYSVTSAGDVDKDGFGDVLIGAKQARKEKLINVGRVYLYKGSKDGLTKEPVWKVSGEGDHDLFGWRVTGSGCQVRKSCSDKEICRCLRAAAGDLNGDGTGDVVVGAYLHDNAKGPTAGKIYAFYSSPGGMPKDPSWEFEGELDGASLGYSVAFGDFNGDGYSDVLAGAPYHRPKGKAYLFLGGPQGLSQVPVWTCEGEGVVEGSGGFGTQVASAGDVNGDGFEDAIVGAPSFRKKGKVYLFYGRKNGKLSQERPWLKRKRFCSEGGNKEGNGSLSWTD